mmetsp:Transcript_13823/g.21180  ORF Transcript_13823/g.21180 Transcript_13823/m.21180 type:complete len:133 (-) Transcript_13823:1686-2084(-)
MLSTLARTSLRASRSRTQVLASTAGGVRQFGIESDLYKKEKVEEDRFIKEQETQILEAKKKAMSDAINRKMSEEQETQHDRMVLQRTALLNSAISELSEVLIQTGDKISPEGAENILIWKLGDKYRSINVKH